MNDPQLHLKVGLSIIVAVVIMGAIITSVLEWRWLKRTGRLTKSCKRKMWLSLSALPPNAVVSILAAPIWTGIYVAASYVTPLHIPFGVTALIVAFLAADMSYYWEHRCSHRVRPIWLMYHAIHHSSDAYTVATAYRVSFLTQIFAPAFYIPWVLLGVDPILIAGFQLFAFHYQAWLHTEMIGRLPGWDRWLNTPANHRVHHSLASRHKDRNLGAVLIIWDKLFGTYAQPEEDLVYGISGESPPEKPYQLYTHTWRKLLSFR